MSVYCACTDFLLVCARLLGLSYRDVNALLFFVVWPALTTVLVVVVTVQGVQLQRRRALRATRALAGDAR